eukprot:5303386-Prorocentrum_lima.AAC.1
MTSSLVGSEMCIRDRSMPCKVVLERFRGCNWAPNEHVQDGSSSVHTDKSVSYTHLTLPTICSV